MFVRTSVILFFLTFLIANAIAALVPYISASSWSPYDSGYDHGCNDADISDPDDRYINQPEKGPSFHTNDFMRGYEDGYDACSDNNGDSNNRNGNEMYSEDGDLLSKDQRAAINPDFDPDHNCLFDTFQLKCIPGSEQECPQGFGSGDPETCFAESFINGKWEWECPEDYHSVEDDETGQCYPDSEGCPDGTIWRGKTAESHTACVNDPDPDGTIRDTRGADEPV